MTTQYPVIINVRDRLSALLDLVAWLEKVGQENIWICDNASTYEPLVDFLHSTDHNVVFNEVNLGHRGPWLSGLVTELGLNSPFIVTDDDVVPSAECPSNALDLFHSTLIQHPDIDKVGFSLRLDDLPSCYAHRNEVILWESQFWQHVHPSGFFVAEIDTTFAMYRAGEGHQNNRALRSKPPYVARHMPWYQDSSHPTEEQCFYVEHADSLIINWDKKVLPASLRAHLQLLRNQHRESVTG